jgi:hypothetical protein
MISLCAAAVLLSPHALAWAQTSATGAVAGRVIDRNGAVVPGAEVELRSAATGESQKQVSGGGCVAKIIFKRGRCSNVFR